MRKKLLFVLNNMTCGGAEKSLLSLLQTMDYGQYEVDLFLLRHDGLFLAQLPKEVRLLPEPAMYRVFDSAPREAVALSLRARRPDLIWPRFKAALLMRSESNKARLEQRMWRLIGRSLRNQEREYDCAIGYLEKTPIYYALDKVKAKRKIGFIHCDYEAYGMDPELDLPYFERLDVLAGVSEESVATLKRVFPGLAGNIRLMHNIVSSEALTALADGPRPWPKREGAALTSVGRLTPSKGFDLAIEACELLLRNGYPVEWRIVGEGDDRGRLEKLIREKGLGGMIKLVGQQANPYPYIKHCDIYVQTSRHEGRCLTVTEAKILGKPIVSTDFKSVHDQLTSGSNGIIVGQDAQSIYEGVKRLLEDKELRDDLVRRLDAEKLDNRGEISKLYEWVG